MSTFYHEFTCKCGKISYIDDFKHNNSKKEKQKCSECHGNMIYLKTRSCRCGNCNCISCLDPNEQCDICNGNMDRDWKNEPDANQSPELEKFVNELKAKRDNKLKIEKMVNKSN